MVNLFILIMKRRRGSCSAEASMTSVETASKTKTEVNKDPATVFSPAQHMSDVMARQMQQNYNMLTFLIQLLSIASA